MTTPAEISRHLGRLATERAYSPRTLASYRADLDLLRALVRTGPGDQLRITRRGGDGVEQEVVLLVLAMR